MAPRLRLSSGTSFGSPPACDVAIPVSSSSLVQRQAAGLSFHGGRSSRARLLMSLSPDIPLHHDRAMPLGTNDPMLSRGWFYRALAPHPDAPVLAVGAPFVRRWFPDVTEGTL